LLGGVENNLFGSSKIFDLLNVVNNFIESEKELGSLDDILFPICLLLSIYCWYFCLSLYLPKLLNFEFYCVFSVFPMLLITVLVLPLNVIYDEGLTFLAYLRGVGTTTLILLELMYDSLATMIMFVRLSVQNIRFGLMFFAFFELYEFVYMNSIVDDNSLSFFTNMFTFKNFTEAPGSTLFYIVLMLPMVFVKGLYQLIHLVFTITSHFIAYLALVF
jgi:hypothetical protein